jgi:hypothetical protein
MMTRTLAQSQDQAPVIVHVPHPGQTQANAEATLLLSTLEARRAELKGQLTSLTERRTLLSVQMQGAGGEARRDLEARIKTLDNRTARIDDELNRIDDEITNALAQGAQRPPSGFEQLIRGATTVQPPPVRGLFGPNFGERITETVIAANAVGFVLLGLFLWVTLRRRVSGPARLGPEDVNRLEQLQRSVDVMAVEVERISEAQRYAAKMLNNPQPEIVARRAEAERVKTGKNTD